MVFKKIYIEITNKCNLSCPFCSPCERKKGELSLEEFDRILFQIQDFTKYVYFHVKGEPLMHPYIEFLIQRAHEKGFFVNITTNGTFLPQFEKISLWPVRQWNFSLHAYEFYTEDLLDDVLKKIFQMWKEGSSYISLRLWTLKNLQEYSPFHLFCLEKIAQIFQVEFPNKRFQKDFKIKERLYLNWDTEFIWPSLKEDIISSTGFCQGLKTHLAILVDGTVVPCCLDGNGIISLGNIFRNSFKEILESERAQEMKVGFSQKILCEDLCQRCGYRVRFH